MDDVVVDSGSAAADTVEETTVNLLDVNGIAVVDDDEMELATPPTAELLHNTMSLKQLKDRCVDLGLSTAGKKMELAERIVSSHP
tara:strand:- start:3299 stop:3553 length:255 start_codon:yes stop_codon:yes gene_type:complete